MYQAHGCYPFDRKLTKTNWINHTRHIPAGAARLLIEQAIRCSGPAGPHDGMPLRDMKDDQNIVFKRSGFTNKDYRVVRSYMDGDVSKVVAVYNHDGDYHLIEALEDEFLAELPKAKEAIPYPSEYEIESHSRRA